MFQIRITELVEPVKILDIDLKGKGGFQHLTRLRQLPFAYATAVVEVVRRKEYSAFLLDWTTKLRETLNKFNATERKRRVQVRDETLSLLPFPLGWQDDTMNPNVDVRVDGGGEALGSMAVDRGDIDRESNIATEADPRPDSRCRGATRRS
jgi:autophagy-related protein 11